MRIRKIRRGGGGKEAAGKAVRYAAYGSELAEGEGDTWKWGEVGEFCGGRVEGANLVGGLGE